MATRDHSEATSGNIMDRLLGTPSLVSPILTSMAAQEKAKAAEPHMVVDQLIMFKVIDKM